MKLEEYLERFCQISNSSRQVNYPCSELRYDCKDMARDVSVVAKLSLVYQEIL